MVRRHFVPMWVLPFLLCAYWFCAAATATAADTAPPADTAAAADQGSAASKDEYYDTYKVLIDTIDEVDRNYVKPIDRRELVEAAIRGVLSKLDPYSSYISPKELSSFVAAVENEFGGVGIQIAVEDGELRVLSPLYGTPAYRAGVLAGDWIVEIDGRSTEGLTQDEAIERLKGAEGSRGDADPGPCRPARQGARQSHAPPRADPRRHRAGRSPQGRRHLGLHARPEVADRLRAGGGLRPRDRPRTPPGHGAVAGTSRSAG